MSILKILADSDRRFMFWAGKIIFGKEIPPTKIIVFRTGTIVVDLNMIVANGKKGR
jgi:hypothetical protein